MASKTPVHVRLNDFARQWAAIGPEVVAAVEAVGASGRYILGTRVADFERDLAAFWNLGFAVGVGSGLDALEIGLRCLGAGAGDRVLTTPLSAFATTLAILRAGATPVFVDVDDSGLLDLDRCEAALRADSRIRFLLPVHLYGHVLDLDRLEALGRERQVMILEDCAQSIGATWRGRASGSVGAAAATSFYPTKNLGALGDGGALLTASPAIAERARALRHYGQTQTYAHEHLGLNSRLDELHAAILAEVMLPRLAHWTATRRRIAARLRVEIEHPSIQLPPVPSGSDSCWHLFPVLVPPARREAFRQHLFAQGVESAVHYPHLIPAQSALIEDGRGETIGELTTARRFCESEVSLPVHPFLRDDEVGRIAAACNRWSDG